MEQALQKNKQRQKWKKNKYSENKNSANRDITGNTGNLLLKRDDDVMSFLKAFRKKHASDFGLIIKELISVNGFVHVTKDKPEEPNTPEPDADQMEKQMYVNDVA